MFVFFVVVVVFFVFFLPVPDKALLDVMVWVVVGWVSLVGLGREKNLRERLADVLIDFRYLTEWSNYLPYRLMCV